MLHIHVGAGRLGLGLVAPFFKTADSELFILNRAVSAANPTGSTALEPARRNQLLAEVPGKKYVIDTPLGRETVQYNGFATYDGDSIDQVVADILERSRQKHRGVVVTASVLKIDSYPSVLRALNVICQEKQRQPDSIGRVFLVACENTVNAGDIFRDEAMSDLIAPEARCHVTPVHALVDRVCVALEEDTSDAHPMVRACTEVYGSLKLQLCPDTEPLVDALRGSRVEFSRHIDTEKQIKSWLLNGTHWLIALRAYAAAQFGGIQKDPRELTLAEYLEAAPENQRFAMNVMEEMREGVEILLHADPHYESFVRDVDVHAYLTKAAAKILERFAQTRDPIKRILARFRAPTREEHRTIEAFNERFAGRVDEPMLAYEAAKGVIPPAASRSIFSLHRLVATGAYVTQE